MGCVQSKCFGCYKQRCFCCCCCSHYQFSSLSTDAAGEADDPFRAQETDPSNRLHALPIVGGAPVPSAGIRLRYASLTQRGYYPDSPDRANQDSFCVYTRFRANAELHFFGVFDGHGQFGAQCSEFARDKITDSLAADARLQEDPAKSCQSSFLAANLALHDSDIDDSMSGTTAITVLVVGSTLYVANVGDSRAVAGVWKGNCVVAEDLSSDQTPYRKDEYERVKLCGARVLSVDQVEGILDPDIQSWGAEEDCDGDPPRLWVQNGMYPGTAFTRSIGDSTAESIGVIAIPEIKTVKITPNHLFFVIASDGVFEFLSSQAVVEMVSMFPDPREACSAIVTESYKLWLEHENRTDDITVIVVHIKDMDDSDVVAAGETIQSNHNAVLSPEKVEIKRHVSSQSERTHPNKNSCRELPLCPLDCSTDKTLPCIAPSSTHAIRLNSINPG